MLFVVRRNIGLFLRACLRGFFEESNLVVGEHLKSLVSTLELRILQLDSLFSTAEISVEKVRSAVRYFHDLDCFI